MGTVYLLVTDLHLHDSAVRARHNYQREMAHVLNELERVINKYKSEGYKVVLLFMGDLFDRSLKNIFEAIYLSDAMKYLRSLVSDAYTVLGNHETTYYKDNPFWTLITEIKSEKIPKLLKKVWQPRGVLQTLKLTDDLEDGEVRFIFNHYGCGIQQPTTGMINIGLFHQDLYAKAIVEDMRANKGLGIYEHTPSYFDSGTPLYGYHHAFFAHAHLFYGKWRYTCETTKFVTNIEYLSTLGRTKENEVNDSFLERNIPAVIVQNGKLISIEDNKFDLLSREECVDEQQVEMQRAQKLKAEETKAIKENYVSFDDDPIENLRKRLAVQPAILQVLNEMLESGTSQYEREILRKAEELL